MSEDALMLDTKMMEAQLKVEKCDVFYGPIL